MIAVLSSLHQLFNQSCVTLQSHTACHNFPTHSDDMMARKRHPPILDRGRPHKCFALVSCVILISLAGAAHGKQGWREQVAEVLNPPNLIKGHLCSMCPVSNVSDCSHLQHDHSVPHIGLKSACTARPACRPTLSCSCLPTPSVLCLRHQQQPPQHRCSSGRPAAGIWPGHQPD